MKAYIKGGTKLVSEKHFKTKTTETHHQTQERGKVMQDARKGNLHNPY